MNEKTYVANALLVTAGLAERVFSMPDYARDGLIRNQWANYATGHKVQLQMHTTRAGMQWFMWCDNADGWAFYAPTKPTDTLSEETVRAEYGIADKDALTEGDFFRVRNGWMLDTGAYFRDRFRDRPYPPTELIHPDPMSWSVPLKAVMHSITTPTGTRVMLPGITLEAPHANKIGAIYTIYENGNIKNGHTAREMCQQDGVRVVTHRRLAVVDITVHNHNGAYMGIPNGVEIGFLDIHEDYEGRSPSLHIAIN